MTYYSRRQLEALGEPLGESVTQTKPGGHGRIYGGGGGGGTQNSTVTQTNIPEWLRPQTEALLGAATQEFFTTKPVGGKAATYDEYGNELTPAVEPTYEITGVKPYTPYSTNVQDYLAGFSPLQQQVQYEASGMMRPGQYGVASDLSGQAGMGGMQSAGQAYGYGQAGYGSGMQGQQLGVQGGQYYGTLGAGYGGQAAAMSPEAQLYGQMGAGTGQQYAQMATDPNAIRAYMSPYTQNVIDVQKQGAIRDYQENIMPQLQAQATRAGAFGGSRDAVQRAMAQRNLASQLQGIEATGLQSAFDKAQQAQQFGITSGLQGLQTGLQGLGQAGQLYGLGMQGAQTGLQGVGQQLAGTAQGMQGAQTGLQGVTGAQAGYNILGQAGTNLANIGTAQQTADLARMQFQAEQGAAQQAQEQAAINQAIQNYGMAQQYPAQQLAMYNALLRGYATPTTTVSQYSAAPSPISQLGGLATAAGAAYGLTKRAGGKIKDEDGIDEILIQKTLKRASK